MTHIVTLTLTVEDIPEAFDPAIGQVIPTAFDGQRQGQRQVVVWKITGPAEGSKHKFGDDRAPFCEIPVAATTAVNWGITGIVGSTVSVLLGNPMASGFVRYDDLPTSNNQFGPKTITASRGNRADRRGVRIFYDKDAKNHGLAMTDPPDAVSWPNWFYYWRQTQAYFGSAQYDPNMPAGLLGQARFFNGAWRAYVGPNAALGPGRLTVDNNAEGIDLFARVCRHEWQHVQDLIAEWGNNPVDPTQDFDGNWLKDALEVGKIIGTPVHGDGYDPARRATWPDHFNYGMGWSDLEDWCIHRHPLWTNGTANSSDWSAGPKSKQWP